MPRVSRGPAATTPRKSQRGTLPCHRGITGPVLSRQGSRTAGSILNGMERDRRMVGTQRTVIVASDNKKRRTLLKGMVERVGCCPKVLGSSWDLCRMPPTPLTILLDTDDDVARLFQIVYQV